MSRKCANQNRPSHEIEPERPKQAQYCLDCAAERKRYWRQKERENNPLYTDYNPEKAKPRSNQATYEWRESNPERWRIHNRNAAAKHRLREKLKLNTKLSDWGLSELEIDGICRRCRIEELPRLAELVTHWEILTTNSPKTVKALFRWVKSSGVGGEQVTGKLPSVTSSIYRPNPAGSFEW